MLVILTSIIVSLKIYIKNGINEKHNSAVHNYILIMYIFQNKAEALIIIIVATGIAESIELQKQFYFFQINRAI